MSEELNQEIEAKRRELGADVPLTGALEALLRDAAATWQDVLLLERRDPARFHNDERGSHWYPGPILDCIPGAFVEHFRGHDGPGKAFLQRDAQAFISWVQQRTGNLTPEMLHRVCVVAGEIRSLIRPVASSGIGADPQACWWLLWLDASGVTAPDIGMTLRPKQPPKRDRIWKLRRKIYEKLAARCESLGCRTESEPDVADATFVP